MPEMPFMGEITVRLEFDASAVKFVSTADLTLNGFFGYGVAMGSPRVGSILSAGRSIGRWYVGDADAPDAKS